jgi:UDP-N-acetyl-D-galactosamine dehydrogenase
MTCNANVDVCDPHVEAEDCRNEFGYDCLRKPAEEGAYDAIIVAVAHCEFREAGVAAIRAWGRPQAVLYDVKGIFPRHQVDGRL